MAAVEDGDVRIGAARSSPPSPPATLRDVASRTGLAVSTVSRALTVPGRVHPETVERVRVAARDLQYTPNGAGRALSSGRTQRIAVVTDNLVNPYFQAVAEGAQQHLGSSGYSYVVATLDGVGGATGQDAVRALRSAVDGAVIATGEQSFEELIEILGPPRCVELTATVQSMSAQRAVVLDGQGVEEALAHLATLGHATIGLADARRGTTWERNLAGAADVAARLGLTVVPLGRFAPSRLAGADVADVALAADVTAVVAYCDLLAFGVVEALAARGFDVPGHISVVGFGDVSGADLLRPALTTVRAPLRRAAARAIELLVDSWRADFEDRPAGAKLTTSLIVRGTSGPNRRA